MDLHQIIEAYDAGNLTADEALELSRCVSLLAMYQLGDAPVDVALNDQVYPDRMETGR